MPLIIPAQQEGPSWLPVMGAQIQFAPIDRPMLRRARRAAIESLGGAQPQAGDDASLAEQLAELGDALSLALLMAGILDWRDVVVMVDDDDTGAGEALACSDEAKSRLLADPIVFEAFDAAYVIPFVTRERERAAPGKDSPLSPPGTGTKEKQESDIAASPALARAADVPNARTSSTKRKPKPKKTSGTS